MPKIIVCQATCRAAYLGGASLAVLLSLAPPASAQLVNEPIAKNWRPSFTESLAPAKDGEARSHDIFLPLAINERQLMFFESKIAPESEIFDLNHPFAFGYRSKIHDGLAVGAFYAYDRTASDWGNGFSRSTAGIEFLGQSWDLRLNAYLPTNKTRHLDALNEAVLEGDRILIRGGEERALRGFDAMAGWRFNLDNSATSWIHAGLGYFQLTDGTGTTLQGPQARLAIEDQDSFGISGARFSFAAEAQRDEIRGLGGYLGMRLSMPLQEVPSARKESESLGLIEQRMGERTIRQRDIATIAGLGAAQAAVDPTTGQELVVRETDAGQNYRAIVEGAAPGQIIVAHGRKGEFNNKDQTLTVKDGVSLIGAGFKLPVRTAGGTQAILDVKGKRPNFTANRGTDVLEARGSAQIAGVNIQAREAAGVRITNGNDAYIHNNRIRAQDGVGVLVQSGSATIERNDFTLRGTGLGVHAHNAQIAIRGNNIEGDGRNIKGILVENSPGAVIYGNDVDLEGGANTAILLRNSPDALILGNEVDLTEGVGIKTEESNNVAIVENDINGRRTRGQVIAIHSTGDDAKIRDNKISVRGNGSAGILASGARALIENNIIDRVGADGFAIMLANASFATGAGNHWTGRGEGAACGVTGTNEGSRVMVSSKDSAEAACPAGATIPQPPDDNPPPNQPAPNPYDQLVMASNPILYLTMSEASTAAERDRSGRGHNGRYYNGVGETAMPNGEDAALFDGIDDYLEVADHDDLSIPPNGVLTIEAWMRPDVEDFPNAIDGKGYLHWLGKGMNDGSEYAMRIYNKNVLPGEQRPGRVSGYAFNLNGGLGAGSYVQENWRAGEWQHIVFVINTRDRSAQYPDGYTIIYKNGVEKDRDRLQIDGTVIRPGNGTAPLRIGSRDLRGYFQGAISRVAIYHSELNRDTVARHHQVGLQD